MAQLGFFFDQGRCSGCRACTVACKNWHGLTPGPLKYLKIYEYENGSFPNVRINFQWIPCFHCEKPACIDACPSGAMYKEDKHGAVLINEKDCTGCRLCYDACPYGAPSFADDTTGVKAQKCTMCVDRLNQSLKPICVLACPMRALDFGPLNDLATRYGNNRDLRDLPDSQLTKPAVIFKPQQPKRQLIVYDVKKALEVMKLRRDFPPVYEDITGFDNSPDGCVGRNRLVLKHKSSAQLNSWTRCDEG